MRKSERKAQQEVVSFMRLQTTCFIAFVLYIIRPSPQLYIATRSTHTGRSLAFGNCSFRNLKIKNKCTNTSHLIAKKIKEEINFACFVFLWQLLSCGILCSSAKKPHAESKVESSLLLALFFIKSAVCLIPFDLIGNSNLVCNRN